MVHGEMEGPLSLRRYESLDLSPGSFLCLCTVSREGSLPSRDQWGPQRWGSLSSVDWEGVTSEGEAKGS